MQATALDGTALATLDDAAWNGLATRALAENPFYSRAHVLAGLSTVDCRTALNALVVRRNNGELAGLFPFKKRSIFALPSPIAESAANLYQFSGLPLVDADDAEAVVAAWLDAMGNTGVPGTWSLADVDLDSPLVGVIEDICARRGFAVHAIGRYRRPSLTRQAGGIDDHIARSIPKRRLRDIERNLRRLGEAGEIAFERADEPRLVEQRLEAFLAMEHAGWKGRTGTSFLSSPSSAAFARAAYRDAVIDSLLLNGEPIAISINIAKGRTAFTPKCTYDEAWRRHAPGVVLEYLAVRAFYADERFDAMDAATTVDGHLVSELWNGSKPMARLVIGPADWRTRLLARSWESGLALRDKAKRLSDGIGRNGWLPGVAARLRTRTGQVLSGLRGRYDGLLAGVLVALPTVAAGIKRHESLAYGLAGL